MANMHASALTTVRRRLKEAGLPFHGIQLMHTSVETRAPVGYLRAETGRLEVRRGAMHRATFGTPIAGKLVPAFTLESAEGGGSEGWSLSPELYTATGAARVAATNHKQEEI